MKTYIKSCNFVFKNSPVVNMIFSLFRFLVILSCFIFNSKVLGQLNDERKKQIDSLLVIAQSEKQSSENRFNAYASITKTIYTNVTFGMEICEEYLALARSLNDTSHIIAAIHFTGFGEKSKGNLILAKNYYEEGLYLAKIIDKPFKICNALANVGNIHLAIGNIDSAYYYHKKSSTLAVAKGFKKLQARSHINLGEIYRIQGNYLKSIENLEAAITICENEKINAYFPTTFIEIGNLNVEIEEYEVAHFYFNKAFESATKNKFYGSMANANIKLAELALVQQKWKEAKVFYKEAENICINNNLPIILITVKRGIGNLQLMTSDYQKAIATLKESLNLMEKLGVQFEIEITYHFLGKAFFELGDYSESTSYLKKAYEIAKKYNSKELMPICFSLYQLHKKLNNNALSLTYFEEYIQAKSIIEDENASKKIIKLEFQRSYDKKRWNDSLNNAIEKEMISKEYHQENQKEKKKTNFILLLFLISLIVLVIVIVFWRNKLNHNKQLVSKNKAIEEILQDKNILLKEINHRVKNNMQIVSSILHFQSKNSDNELVINALNETQNRLQSIQLVHQKIYDTKNFEQVNLTNYSKELVQVLSDSIIPSDCDIEIQGNDVLVNVEQVQAIGFILHELISNSVKYAWKRAKNKKISINIATKTDDEITLKYCDNGKGITQPLVFENISSFGLKLIFALVKRQLMGTIEYTNSQESCFTIKFQKR